MKADSDHAAIGTQPGHRVLAWAVCAATLLVLPLACPAQDTAVEDTIVLLDDRWQPVPDPARTDPRLLTATLRKLLELAHPPPPKGTAPTVICIGLGRSCLDPTPHLMTALASAAQSLRPASACWTNHAISERATDRNASLLRLDAIEHRSHDSARVHASVFSTTSSGTGWRCDAVRTGAQWIVGRCRMTWKL